SHRHAVQREPPEEHTRPVLHVLGDDVQVAPLRARVRDGGRSGHHGLPRVKPPSTVSVVPVMYEASSELRKSIAAATSAAVPSRPPTVSWSTRQARCISSPMAAVIGVLMNPGATALTRMPSRMSSFAAARVIPITAAFAPE